MIYSIKDEVEYKTIILYNNCLNYIINSPLNMKNILKWKSLKFLLISDHLYLIDKNSIY